MASVEDTRTDDGSHKSNSPRHAEATGISETQQMDTCTGLGERGSGSSLQKSFLMKGSSLTGWGAEWHHPTGHCPISRMLTFFRNYQTSFDVKGVFGHPISKP